MKPLLAVHNHVPKTGGNFVRHCFLESGFPVAHLPAGRERWEDHELELGGYVGSHFLFRAGRPALEELGRPAVVFSLVRDPVDMFFSAFHYWRRLRIRTPDLPAPLDRQVELLRSARTLEEYSSERFLEAAEVDPFPAGWFPDPDSLDFLGVSEKMGSSIVAIGELVGARLRISRAKNVGRYNRRARPNVAGLRRRFELEEDVWRSARGALN